MAEGPCGHLPSHLARQSCSPPCSAPSSGGLGTSPSTWIATTDMLMAKGRRPGGTLHMHTALLGACKQTGRQRGGLGRPGLSGGARRRACPLARGGAGHSLQAHLAHKHGQLGCRKDEGKEREGGGGGEGRGGKERPRRHAQGAQQQRVAHAAAQAVQQGAARQRAQRACTQGDRQAGDPSRGDVLKR